MENLTIDFIFNNELDRFYSKFKETDKAICFTWDFKGIKKNCSCRMVGCYHKSTPYVKRYYVWIPKSILKKGIVNDFGIKTKSSIEDRVTIYNIKIERKYLESSFSHYLKKNAA
jgi:hypothetical protein